MPAPPPPPAVEEGQFDDAPTDRLPKGFRQDNYSDDTAPEQSEDSSEGDDDFDSDDDLARVEDEDWEIAERGGSSNPTLLCFSFDLPS
jgi:hypothetical protein